MNLTAGRRPYYILAAIVLAGLGLRLKGITYSLNEDELLYAIRILYPKESLADWYAVLSQPVLFGLSGELGILLFGHTKLALRFFPMLAGMATIILAFFTGRRLGDATAGLLASFFMAMSFTLAGYSQIFRPYALQIFLTLLLIHAGLWVWERMTLRRTIILTLIAMAATLSSYPAAFVQGGLGIMLLIHYFRLTEKTKVRTASLGIYIGWLVAAGVLILLPATRPLLVPAQSADTMAVYWNQFYWPALGFANGLSVLANNTQELIIQFLPFAGQHHVAAIFLSLSIFVALIGFGSLGRSDVGRAFRWLFLGTLLAHFVALAVGLWSFLFRHGLYLAPFYLLLLGKGAAETGRWLSEKRFRAALVLCLIILALLPLRAITKNPGIYYGAEYGWKPFVEMLEKDIQDGDGIYLGTFSACNFVYSLEPERTDLAKSLYAARRRIFPLFEPPLPVPGEWFDLFGRRALVVLGGGDLSPLIKAKVPRVWVLICHKAVRMDLGKPVAQLEPHYRLVKKWQPRPPSIAWWALYERVDQEAE